MNNAERKEIEELQATVKGLAQMISDFKDLTVQVVTDTRDKVEAKHLPVELEQRIADATRDSIATRIKKILVDDYNSPLKLLIVEVVNSRAKELKSAITEAFDFALKQDEFMAGLKQQVLHKVSRAIFFDNQSIIDKVATQLKQDPTFKAKILLAIEKVVTEVSEDIKNNKFNEGGN